MYKLEILHQSVKKVKTKSKKVLEANSSVCKIYRGKPLRRGGGGGGRMFAPILNRVKPLTEIIFFELTYYK